MTDESPTNSIGANPGAADSIDTDSIDAATARIIDLEAELEASGNATRDDAGLVRARALLHEWVDSVVAVVATPGVGRVVLVHANGTESRISSPELPFLLAEPVRFS